MAKDYKREDILYPDQKIIQSELVHEMQTSYIEYAMSVIVGRALPDVRDGLKPVHRRILYAMYEDNLTSDKPFKKSATCVGDVLGRYHPHGDASVYDAMVRLAQDFSMRYMLVDGHGNFGSVDGDPPAAYRYTEARLSKIANEMLRDIDKDTVDWDPNFDETRREPRVLPCRFPNLLVNGSSGIAVGMATNIPPHNLTEVINACVCVLENPDATLSDLMQHVTGPDFPTRGIIVGRSGIRAAYATGRGRIVVRAKSEIEEMGGNRQRIVVTEIPYMVNKSQLVEKIAELVNEATEGKIQLTIQAGGVLGGEADTLDMAIQGDLDIATCANSVLSNYIPEMSILDQAFLWDSADQANYAVQNELGDLISAEAEKHGFHVIGYLESGFRDVFSKKPIQTPADFKGVKIRVMQNEGQLAAFTAFGANPVAISASEQFTALQQGTIDACENAVSNCWINKYYEAGVNSITNTKHCFVYIPICMSDNAWNKIPEDMREPFVNAVQEGCKAQWTYLNEANAEAVENLEGAGVTFYDIDTEALKAEYQAAQEKNGASYDEKWAAAVDAAKSAVQ